MRGQDRYNSNSNRNRGTDKYKGDASARSRSVRYETSQLGLPTEIQHNNGGAYVFTVPELPYSYNALEPYIDSQTMEIHVTRHHKGYVNSLNDFVQQNANTVGSRDLLELLYYASSLEKKLYLEQRDKMDRREKSKIKSMVKDIRNYAGGHLNHSMFWQFLTTEKKEIGNRFSSLLADAFGGLNDFQGYFESVAMSRIGSYWTWLVAEGTKEDHKLRVLCTQNQDNPVTLGCFPLLGLDMWEHAYYLAYFNDKSSYAKNFWNIVNWTYVEELYASFLLSGSN